jgi:hypothetical protein
METTNYKLFEIEQKYFKAKRETYNLRRIMERLKDFKENGVLYSGEQVHPSEEMGCTWFIFPPYLDDDQILSRLHNLGYEEDLYRGVYDDNDWDCSGKILTNEPLIIKRTRTRVLAVCSWFCDV